MKTKATDLTEGNPLKVILIFAVPMFLGSLFQQLYNITDTIIVGHALGDNALAAVGATSPIYNLVMNLANGMTTGFAIIVARYFGARDENGMKKAVATTVILTFILTIFITALSLMFLKPLLYVLNIPSEIMEDSYIYIVIILAGIFTTMFYNMATALLRAVGNSSAALYILIISVIANIAMDLIFVYVLKAGIAGAAIATVIAQLMSVIICLIYIKAKFPILLFAKKDMVFQDNILKEMFSTGISLGCMYSIVNIGNLIVQYAVNGLGTQIIAAHIAARKLNNIFMLPLSSLGNAISMFASQNYGAGKMKRVWEGTKKSIIVGAIWSTFAVLVTFVAAPEMVNGMTGTTDQKVMSSAILYMKINIPFYYALGALFILRSMLQSISRKITPLIASSIELLSKFVVVFILAPKMGYLGVCISEPIIWTVCAIFLFIDMIFIKRLREKANLKVEVSC